MSVNGFSVKWDFSGKYFHLACVYYTRIYAPLSSMSYFWNSFTMVSFSLRRSLSVSLNFNVIYNSIRIRFSKCLIVLKLRNLCECDLPKLIRYLNDLTMLFKMLFEMCSNVVWHGLPSFKVGSSGFPSKSSFTCKHTHTHKPNGKSDFLLTLIITSKWWWWWWWHQVMKTFPFLRVSQHTPIWTTHLLFTHTNSHFIRLHYNFRANFSFSRFLKFIFLEKQTHRIAFDVRKN